MPPKKEMTAEELFGEPSADDEVLGADDGEERLHPVLSNEEYRAAQVAARKSLEKERKVAAREAVIKEETVRLRHEGGLSTGIEAKDEMVSITIDLPEWTPSIVVNQFPYYHGRTYTVPRHVYDSLREQMWRANRHDDQLSGKSLRETMRPKYESAINGNTGAAVGRMARRPDAEVEQVAI